MTEYTVLWLIVFAFIVVGALTSILFFRRRSSQPGGYRGFRKHRDLDSILFR